MATYNFKSVGKTIEDVQNSVSSVSQKIYPVGIKTPIKLKKGSFIETTFLLEDQASDNFRNLLQTNFGERLANCTFGANLRPLTLEFSSLENFDSEAMSRITSAVSRWMPYIELVDFSSAMNRRENKNTAIIEITITYNIPGIQVFGKKIKTVLYVI